MLIITFYGQMLVVREEYRTVEYLKTHGYITRSDIVKWRSEGGLTDLQNIASRPSENLADIRNHIANHLKHNRST